MLWDAEEHLRIANEVVQLAEALGDKELTARGLFLRVAFSVITGDFKTATAEIDRFGTLADELRIPEFVWMRERWSLCGRSSPGGWRRRRRWPPRRLGRAHRIP
jgi:hypothetical protein